MAGEPHPQAKVVLELLEVDSHEENAEGYFLERADMGWFLDKYVRRETDLRIQYFAPLLATDLSTVPSATVVTAGFDPLRDEGEAYADRLREADITVDHRRYEGMIHGFASMIGAIDAADDAVEAVADTLRGAF